MKSNWNVIGILLNNESNYEYLKICNKSMNYTQFRSMEINIYDSVRRQSENVIQSESNQRTKSQSLLGIHNNKLVSKQDHSSLRPFSRFYE